MTASIKPIQTVWRGYKFRSRLEARWGVYFSNVGIQWEYEPEGFEFSDGARYLPDFWLPEVKMWAEVKPTTPDSREIMLAKHLLIGSGNPVIFLVGTPDVCSYWYLDFDHDENEVFENDCILDTQYLDENRFYSSTGESSSGRFVPCLLSDWGLPDVNQAVRAARSARFEYGELPL